MPYICSTGKRRFDTIADAEARLREIEAHPQTSYIPSRPYSCDECGGVHLTSQSVTRRAAFLRAYPTADGAKCHLCGKPIAGKVYIVGGHPQCGTCFALPRTAVGVVQRHRSP